MPFIKGQSGNPGGRAKGLPAAYRNREGRKSVDFLVQIRNDPKVDDRDRITAAKIILGYTYGQPAQSVEIGGADGAPVSVSIVIEGPK